MNWKRMGQGFAVVLLTSVLGLQASSQTKAASSKAPPAKAEATKALGSRTAPVTVEVFSDFQCPACKGLYQSTLRPLIQDYVSTGKVYLVHRDFPLENIHKHSREAARYANAAAGVGKFEKAAEALYATQEIWSADGNVDAVIAAVMTPADMRRIRDEVRSPAKLDSSINEDVRLGGKVPVRSTPTVLVLHRGKTYPLPPGGVNYSLLRAFIDDLLRQ